MQEGNKTHSMSNGHRRSMLHFSIPEEEHETFEARGGKSKALPNGGRKLN
jgi:hypothetical protein